MHYWIVEVDLFETRSKEHAAKRSELNDELIGTLVYVAPVVVQGVAIKKPAWFRDAEVDVDQMMRQMGSRRNR